LEVVAAAVSWNVAAAAPLAKLWHRIFACISAL